jgi:fructokinase
MDNIESLCWRSLIDFIGHQEGVLNETRDYHRYLGGLYQCCYELNKIRFECYNGRYGWRWWFWILYFREIMKLVNTSHIKTLDNKSTSVIFVSRSSGWFHPLVKQIVVFMKNKFQAKYYLKLKYFILFCFSKKTCTENILKKAAYDLGCKL